MNDQERREFDLLKRQQSRLQQELADLSMQLEAFESRLQRRGAESVPQPSPAAPATERTHKEQVPDFPKISSSPSGGELSPGLVPPVIASVTTPARPLLEKMTTVA